MESGTQALVLVVTCQRREERRGRQSEVKGEVRFKVHGRTFSAQPGLTTTPPKHLQSNLKSPSTHNNTTTSQSCRYVSPSYPPPPSFSPSASSIYLAPRKAILALTPPGLQLNLQRRHPPTHRKPNRQLPAPPPPHEDPRTSLYPPPRRLPPTSPQSRTRFRILRCARRSALPV